LIYGIHTEIIVDRWNLLLSIGLLSGSIIIIWSLFLLYKRKLNKSFGIILIWIYIMYLVFNILKIYSIL
jgi:Ca2+/Na+ antiporter